MDDAGRNVYWGARNAVRAARNGAPSATRTGAHATGARRAMNGYDGRDRID